MSSEENVVGVSVDRKKIFVDGDFDEGANGEWREVLNPATGEVIAEVPECSAEDVDRAVRAARGAFDEWFDTTPAERSLMLHRLVGALEENAEELAQIESRNVGKPISSAQGSCPTSSTTCATSPGWRATSRANRPASTCVGTRA
jgi:acyl-CoA reductase-like NAD-dependent aldehyde dehydrogenase